MAEAEVPKALLLVNSDPNSRGIGEIFLRDLARFYPCGRLIRFSTVPGNASAGEATWCGQKSITQPVAMSALPILSSLREWEFDAKIKPYLLARICDLARTHNIDLVWCVANSPSIISLVDSLVDRMHLPFVTTVWDTPTYFALNQWLDPLTNRKMQQRFERILRTSERVAVTGEDMRKTFFRRYGIEGISCLHGIDPSLVDAGRRERSYDGPLVIGFAGSLYAKAEWNALLEAIKSLGGFVAGRRVVVRFIGRFPRTLAHNAPFVEQFGSLSLADTLSALRTADIAYLPYWFNKRRRYVVQTAFPSKISTYVAAGLPILYHGPYDSSPTHFFAQYPLGLTCHSLDRSRIADALNCLATDATLLAAALTARQSVLSGVLSQEAMLASFAALLGIDRDLLVDVPRAENLQQAGAR